MKNYLVNFVLPNTGNSKAVSDYIQDLLNKGYNRYQAIGSLGGASHGKSITIVSKTATRN